MGPITSSSCSALALAGALAVLVPGGAGASVLYSANGFEGGAFAPGALPGQDGWVQLQGRNSSATVHDVASGLPVRSGAQAVTLTRDGGDGPQPSAFTVPLSAQVFQAPFVTVSWDMFVPQNPNLDEFGPGFSMEVYTTGTRRIAALGMDAADGSLYQVVNNNPSTPTFILTPDVRLGEWQSWKLALDLANELVYLAVDGNTIVNGSPLLEDIDYAGGDKLIDASITLHATDNNFLGVSGEAYLDNYRITDGFALSAPGDYNGSGLVEQGDLDLVLQNWGSPASPVPAGWVNNLPAGLIDQAELDAVLQNWGSTVFSAPLFPGSVPEPAAAVVVVGGGLLVLGMGRRRECRAA